MESLPAERAAVFFCPHLEAQRATTGVQSEVAFKAGNETDEYFPSEDMEDVSCGAATHAY